MKKIIRYLIVFLIFMSLDMNFEGIKTVAITEEKNINEINLRGSSNIEQAVNNIYLAKGTVSNYRTLGLDKVTSSNLVWINAEVQDRVDLSIPEAKVDERKSSIINAVNEAMEDYRDIKAINDGKEGYSNSDILEYHTVTGRYIRKEYLSSIRTVVTIGKDLKGRELTKKELRYLINKYMDDIDSKYIIWPIRKAIDEAKLNGNNLSEEEVRKIINETIEKINVSYEKIVKGEADLNDYLFIRIDGVKKENIVWINAEIKERVDIKLILESVDGKIDKVQTALNKLLEDVYPAVKAINDGKEGYTNSDVGEYYKVTGRYIRKGYLSLVRKAVTIGKDLKGRELTKKELKYLINKCVDDEDSAYIVSVIRRKIDEAIEKKQRNLTCREVSVIINYYTYYMDKAYEKVVNGEADLNDYSTILIKSVTKENIVWVNAEIKEKIDIKLIQENSAGKISKVNEAIGDLLKNVYPKVKIINDGKETCDNQNVLEYYYVSGKEVSKYDLPFIRIAVTIGKDLKGRELTKNEVKYLLNKYINDADSDYIIRPIRNAIDKAKLNGKNLSEEEVEKIINETIEKINVSYNKVVKGEADLSDYLFIRISGITKENIAWVNAEIKERIDIKLVQEKSAGKINRVNKAIKSLLKDIYPNVKIINDGKETCDNRVVNEYYSVARREISKYRLAEARQAIAKAKLQKGRELTKTEIIKVLQLFKSI